MCLIIIVIILSNYCSFGLTVVKSNVSFFIIIFRVYFSRKEPRGGQRGILGRGKIRIIALNIRAMAQYGGGMGGVLSIKKDFDKPPCKFSCLMCRVRFLKNIVNYCKIQYIYKKKKSK